MEQRGVAASARETHHHSPSAAEWHGTRATGHTARAQESSTRRDGVPVTRRAAEGAYPRHRGTGSVLAPGNRSRRSSGARTTGAPGCDGQTRRGCTGQRTRRAGSGRRRRNWVAARARSVRGTARACAAGAAWRAGAYRTRARDGRNFATVASQCGLQRPQGASSGRTASCVWGKRVRGRVQTTRKFTVRCL